MRFVVLHHTAWVGHPDHFDVMLQTKPGRDDDDPVLKTWATVANDFPNGRAGGSLLRALPNHRQLYLHYEGAVPGARGNVTRVDEGTLCWLTDPADNIVQTLFTLAGTALFGTFRLRRESDDGYCFQKTT